MWVLGAIGGVDGVVTIDLKNLQQFSMDHTTFTATIGAVTLLDEVTNQLHHAGDRANAYGTPPQVSYATRNLSPTQISPESSHGTRVEFHDIGSLEAAEAARSFFRISLEW